MVKVDDGVLKYYYALLIPRPQIEFRKGNANCCFGIPENCFISFIEMLTLVLNMLAIMS